MAWNSKPKTDKGTEDIKELVELIKNMSYKTLKAVGIGLAEAAEKTYGDAHSARRGGGGITSVTPDEWSSTLFEWAENFENLSQKPPTKPELLNE